mgnify:CR=1 FL=1
MLQIGGEMLEDYKGWKVKLEVHNYRGTIKSSNVVGYITGDVEPDRLVKHYRFGEQKKYYYFSI